MIKCNHTIENIQFISTSDLGLSDNSFVQMPTVVEMSDCIKVFFSTRDAHGFAMAYVLELSKSLPFRILNVHKLDLNFGKPGHHDESGIMPSSLIKINEQFFMYYVGWTRLKSVPYKLSIGLAKSDLDGNRFEKFSEGPLMSTSVENPYFVTTPHVRYVSGKFEMLYSSGNHWVSHKNKYESTYFIKKCESTDGFNWVKHQTVRGHDDLSYCLARPVVYKNHLFFSKRPTIDFRKEGNGYRILMLNNQNPDKTNLCHVEWQKNSENSLDVAYGYPFEIGGEDYLFFNGKSFGKHGMHISKISSENRL